MLFISGTRLLREKNDIIILVRSIGAHYSEQRFE